MSALLQSIHLPELTSFESEVLQVIEAIVVEHVSSVYAHRIIWFGYEQFGHGWGGRSRDTASKVTTHPTIDSALGRLRRKGYIQKVKVLHSISPNRHAWEFTAAGRSLLGLPVL